MKVIENRHADILNLLLDGGADPNAGEDEARPLTAAAWNGDYAMVKALLKKGADPTYRDRQAECMDGNDYSALFAATTN